MMKAQIKFQDYYQMSLKPGNDTGNITKITLGKTPKGPGNDKYVE
jgi:hypothetical protein